MTLLTGGFDEKEELRSLLKGINKEKFLNNLLDSSSTESFSSCNAIAALPPDELPQGIPKMVARMIKKTAQETKELRFLCLRSEKASPRYDYFEALLAANLRSLQDITSRAVEDLPAPKMKARLVHKKALQLVEARELWEFLKDCNKEQYLFALISTLGMTTPKDVKDCKAFGTAVPKMIARVLQNRANEVCKPDEPNYQIKLTEDVKRQVRQIWSMISSVKRKIFGEAFYENMLVFDSAAVRIFAGVNLTTIGKDFDVFMNTLIQDDIIDNEEKFTKHRDDLISRLMRYRIPVETLWKAVDAFETAAVLVNPEIEVLCNLQPWRIFYFAIIPPLHPLLLKSIPLDRTTESGEKAHHELLVGTDFQDKLADWFARQGHVYFYHYLRDHPDYCSKLVLSFESLEAWTLGAGSWDDFVSHMKNLLEDRQEVSRFNVGVLTNELRQLLLVMTCRAIEDLSLSPALVVCVEGVLMAGGIALFGTSMFETYRSVQKDLVWDQWYSIYRFSAEECGELVYEHFTADEYGKAMFSRTNMVRQREVFIDQLNSSLIRINESNDGMLREMLIDLGFIHRKLHQVESIALKGFEAPLKQTISEMLGRTAWRQRTIDSWSYVLRAILTRYMVVGWACGGVQRDKFTDWGLIRAFRDSNEVKYPIFFHRFAERMASVGLLHAGSDVPNAGARYMAAVNGILDEPDPLLAIDRVEALKRRHLKFHGVSSGQLEEAGKIWMDCASKVFGEDFPHETKLNFARFFLIISFSGTKAALEKQLEEISSKTEEKANQEDSTLLVLQEKITCSEELAILRFKSNKPVPQRGGQFLKLRITIGDRTASRYYSVASAPDPATDTSANLEFLIKEVKGGKASPFLVHKITPYTRVEYLTTAGSFALPKPIDDCRRIMISAGVGIVAFISAVRQVSKMAELQMLNKKVHLSLIHSERTLDLPYFDELIQIAHTYSNHDYFQFDLTLCFTGKSLDEAKLDTFRSKCPRLYLQRTDSAIMSSALEEFSVPAETPMYACGPREYQKMVRETFLKDLGHPRKLVNLEFFDL